MPTDPHPGPLSLPALEATAFLLKDPTGTTRARLGIDSAGHVALVFYDPAGKVRASLGTFDDGTPLLELCDGRQSTRVHVGLDEQSLPTIVLFDADMLHRATIALDDDGAPIVMLLGGVPGPTASLCSEPGDGAALVFKDSKGQPAVVVGLDGEDSRTVSLADGKGEHRLALWMTKDGVPGFTMLDEDGEEIVGG